MFSANLSKRRRWVPQQAVGLVMLGTLALVIASWHFEPALALLTAQRAVGSNTFTTRSLVAPASLTANPLGHDAKLTWPAGLNGNGYNVLGVANGGSNNCTAATFVSLASTAATSYTDVGRFAPQGTWFCYQVQTTYGSWNSVAGNPIAATQVGFVATTVQLLNAGNTAGCAVGSFGQAGVLDCGDQLALNFNQAVDTTTGPTNSQTICASTKSGLLLGSTTASGACDTAVFKVGTFTKSTAGAPASQAVPHGLGQTPKAVILWTAAVTNSSFTGSFIYAYGMSDGTTSKSISAASQDVHSKSNTSARMANKALTLVKWGQVLVAEADLSSLDATNFTLNWTTNSTDAYMIHYLVIGGPNVSAKVVGWLLANATGNLSVTGTGFKPDLVIHAFPGSAFTAAPPANAADADLGLGAMDAAGNQWASFFLSKDNRPTSDTQRGQQTNAAIYTVNNTLGITKRAAFVSMDADGFTLNFSSANGSNTQAFSLALKGIKARAGNFNKATGAAPAGQSLSGVGFQPAAVILSSFADVAQANPVVQTRFGLGASDGSSAGSVALSDANALGTTAVTSIGKTSKVFMKVDNVTPVVDAEADLSSLDADGFTLNWTTNDNVATQMLYLALGSPATAEPLYLGQLTGGTIGTCGCRYGATYTWGNGNQTLTITVGARLSGANDPAMGSAIWTFSPTTLITRVLSSSGAFHICDTNAGGGNCLPATSGASALAPSHYSPQGTREPEPTVGVTPTPSATPGASATVTPTATPTLSATPGASATVTPTATALPSATPTWIATALPTATPTPTPIPSSTVTPSPPPPTATPALTATATILPSPTATASAPASPAPTQRPTTLPSQTPTSATATPTATARPAVTTGASATPSPHPTQAQTTSTPVTPSPTPTPS
jgi:hypothetical protein